MKRILVALAIMLVAVGAAAQDTLHANHPFSNYLSNYWWDFKDGDSVFCNLSSNYPSNAYKGLVMYNPDTLPIYGLAVGVLLYPADEQVISDPLNGWTVLPGDTSLDNTYMDFVIMQVDSYSFSVYAASAPLRLHIKYEPVSYYLDNRLIMNVQYQPDPCEPFPVYELYFDSAVTVFDKFYIGGRNHSDTGIAPVQNIYPHIRVAGWLNPVGGVARHFVINWQHTDPYPGYQSSTQEWQEYNNILWEWFFPILTPNPDTTSYVPDDSTAVQRAVWERYVAVQPNPATDKATVLSSVGLTQVEVFDIAGNRVLVQEASGLSAKLDVGILPRGTYIIRIHTPMGTTARKLLLQ